jgi:ADP-ribose pyrophosphatase
VSPHLLPDLQPPHLREERLDGRSVYRGHFLDVRRDEVRLPDGLCTVREYIAHPGAVMVIPLLDDGRVVVELQYRYPVGQAMIEFPAGKLEPDEPVLACAQRELLEETGYRAREWARAGLMHPTIGYSDEVIEIWFARQLDLGERQLDKGEFLDVLAVQPDELFSACLQGSLTDGKSLAGLLWLQNVQRGQWVLQWQLVDGPDCG